MVWTTLLSAISYCRFYARHSSRHLLLPVPAFPGYCLSLEIFPSWAISQLLRPLPSRLATSQCRLLVSPTVTYNCVAVQFCKVLFSPLYNVVGFAKAFPVFVLYGVGLPFFCNSQSFYQLICFFAIVLPDVILNILTLYINPRLFYLFMLLLIFCLIALYFLASSAVSYLPFFSALHSFHRSGCQLWPTVFWLLCVCLRFH